MPLTVPRPCVSAADVTLGRITELVPDPSAEDLSVRGRAGWNHFGPNHARLLQPRQSKRARHGDYDGYRRSSPSSVGICCGAIDYAAGRADCCSGGFRVSHSGMIFNVSRRRAEGGFVGLRTAASIAVLAGAVGSVGFLLRATNRNPSQLLVVLMAIWVVCPSWHCFGPTSLRSAGRC